MIANAPRTRRKFAHEWDEIEYLYFKMLFWAYENENYRLAARFSDRLAKLLNRFDPKCEAILGVSARALIAEVDGRTEAAIRFRNREIELLEKLLRINGAAAFDLGPDDVSDRMIVVASLLWDLGDLNLARKTLEKSRSYCRKHRIRFDGEDMLAELLLELTPSNGQRRKTLSTVRKAKAS